MVDAERLFGSLADRSHLGIKRCGVECRCAERTEAAGIGYGGDERRGSRVAHTSENNGIGDAEQIANPCVNHSASCAAGCAGEKLFQRLADLANDTKVEYLLGKDRLR